MWRILPGDRTTLVVTDLRRITPFHRTLKHSPRSSLRSGGREPPLVFGPPRVFFAQEAHLFFIHYGVFDFRFSSRVYVLSYVQNEDSVT